MLLHKWISNARVFPYERPIQPGFMGGLEVPDIEADSALRHHRTRKPVDRPPEFVEEQLEVLPGEYIYAGPFLTQFGHFMSESIHRIALARQISPGAPLLFVGTKRGGRLSEAPGFVSQVLEFLGIPIGQARLLSRPAKVDRLLVHEQGADLGGGPKPEYLDWLDSFSERRLDELGCVHPTYERVYVSRSAIASGCLLGESLVEAALERQGFHIFRPERHSIAEQMDVYRKAEVIVFPEGSACHGVELLGRSLRRVALINRRQAAKVKIFQSLLKPRSGEYMEFRDNIYVDALPVGRNGQALRYVGVSVFDLEGLRSFFSKHRLADLDKEISGPGYEAAVMSDLQRYVEWALQQPAADGQQVLQAVPGLERQVLAAVRNISRDGR